MAKQREWPELVGGGDVYFNKAQRLKFYRCPSAVCYIHSFIIISHFSLQLRFRIVITWIPTTMQCNWHDSAPERGIRGPSRDPLCNIQALAPICGTRSPSQSSEVGLWSCRTSSALVWLSKRAGRKVKRQGNLWVREGEQPKENKSEGEK